MTRLQSICLAILAAMALVSLTAVHLDSQGAYYDELHQAPSAFHYVDSDPVLFTQTYLGAPLLNMTYSGALKSAVYGVYLKLVNPHFSLVTWRLVGIGFVAAGLMVFYLAGGSSLRMDGAIAFAGLLLTDVSVLVTTRHDWGPVALALCLRLAFIAVWLSLAVGQATNYRVGLAGFLVGIAIFEKLSNVVLVAPLAILLAMTPRTPGAQWRTWAAAAVGVVTGMLPLLSFNVATFRLGQGFVSLTDVVRDKAPFQFSQLAAFAYHYLSLGQGILAKDFVLGQRSNSLFAWSEAVLMGALLLFVTVAALRARGASNKPMRLAVAMAGTYVAVAIGLLVMPRNTFVHHWILGTPFQYAAFAIAATGLNRRGRVYTVLLAGIVCLMALRIPTLLQTERGMAAGSASHRFDPAFSRLAHVAASTSKDAIWISSDWGSATQLYCAGHGRDEWVFEPYLDGNPGEAALKIAARTTKTTLYVVTTGQAPQFAQQSASIIDAIEHAPAWTAAAPEDPLADLGRIQVRKFVRR